MKILFYALTQSQGGIENFIFTYYSNMKNITIDFIALGNPVVYEEELKKLGGNMIHLSDKHSGRSRYYQELKAVVQKGNYDVVWFNDNNLCDIQLLKYAEAYEVPVRICHSHGAGLTSGFLHKLRHYQNRRIVLRKATDYWACSEMAARWAFGKKCNELKVKIIPNAIEVERYQFQESTRKRIREELGIEDKYVVGHVGRFCEEKNHKFLLQLFKEFKKVQKQSVLLLVGTGELKQQMKLYAEELGIIENVFFLGQRKDVYEILQGMDVFLIPSRSEGLCIAAVEAQAAGLPCIVSDAIPKEVKLTPHIQYLKLNDGIMSWVNEMCKVSKPNKAEMFQCIYKSPYNIKNMAYKLEQWFQRSSS